MNKILATAASLTLAMMAANCAPGGATTTAGGGSTSSGSAATSTQTGSGGVSSGGNSSGGNSSGGNSSGGNSSGGNSGGGNSSGTANSGGGGACGTNITTETALPFTLGMPTNARACGGNLEDPEPFFYRNTGTFAEGDTLRITTTGLSGDAKDVDVQLLYVDATGAMPTLEELCRSVELAGSDEDCDGVLPIATTDIFVVAVPYAEDLDPIDQSFQFTVTRTAGGTSSSGGGASSADGSASSAGTASSGG